MRREYDQHLKLHPWKIVAVATLGVIAFYLGFTSPTRMQAESPRVLGESVWVE